MLNVNDRVKVIAKNRFNGLTGIVTSIYPASIMSGEPVYMVKYDGNNSKSGMFKESELSHTIESN
jgi:hypothetical protein